MFACLKKISNILSFKEIRRNYFIRRALRDQKNYKSMIESHNPLFIHELNHQAAKIPIKLNKSWISFFFRIERLEEFELSVQQFCVRNYLGSFRLNRSLISAIYGSCTPITKELPPDWLAFLRLNNIPIHYWRCTLLFKLSLYRQIIKGVIFIFREVVGRNSAEINVPYVKFFGLNKYCLLPRDDRHSYGLMSWYSRIRDFKTHLYFQDCAYLDEAGNSRVRYSKKITPNFLSLSARISFFAKGVLAVFIAMFSVFGKNWAYSLMFYELMLKERFRHSSRELMAEDYVFTISDMVYRPLWTYVAEQRGCRIVLLNYSSSFSQFLTSHGYIPDEYEYEISTWPYFYNWSGPYSEHLKSICRSTTKIITTDPIWWADQDECGLLKSMNKPIIALFDVQPMRPFFWPDYGSYYLYRTYKIGRQFLLDIEEEIRNRDFVLAYKRKREFSQKNDKRYINFSQNFCSSENVIEVPSNVSPFRLVNFCIASISAPFTSTAFISKSQSIPAAFYDPSGYIKTGDRGSQALPLIQNRAELGIWLDSLLVS